MGREIRRVPANWEHPRNARGQFAPMHDVAYEDAAKEWLDGCIKWANGKIGTDKQRKEFQFYWDWAGPPPDEKEHRPKWSDEERTHFQIYETVSEGTPVSPVFSSKEEIISWMMLPIPKNERYPDLSMQGCSREQAERFVEASWAPSFIVLTGGSSGPGHKMLPDAKKEI